VGAVFVALPCRDCRSLTLGNNLAAGKPPETTGMAPCKTMREAMPGHML
jgi:hypothetical protein